MSSDEDDRRTGIHDAHTTGMAAASTLGHGLGRKADRSDVWKVALAISVLCAAAAIGVGVLATHQIVDLKAEQVSSRARLEAEQERARKAIADLQEANEALQRRGQQPVPAPAEPGSDDALVAAATAKVLAALPPAPGPTAEQVANGIASYLIIHPVQVPPTAIAAQVAAYLTANPPPPGPTGQKGDPGEKGNQGQKGDQGTAGVDGKTPTPDEVMAVFNAAVAQNPDVLCAGRGKFTEVVGFVRVPPENVPQERSFWTCLPE